MIATLASLIAIAAAVAPWWISLSSVEAAAVSFAVGALACVSIRRFLAPGIARVACGEHGWTLAAAGGEAEAAELIRHIRVGPFVRLVFRRRDRSRIGIVVAPDGLDADTRRRLILSLARAEVARAS